VRLALLPAKTPVRLELCVHPRSSAVIFSTSNPPSRGVAGRLLKPLGNPRHDAIKCFATSELLEPSNGKAWLVKVTNAVNHHWQKNNAATKKNFDGLTLKYN
jgi:hypothetical protein